MDKIICINSTDTEVLSEKKKELISGLKASSEITNIDLKETSCGTVLSELLTIPFLVDFKIVVLRNALLFSKNDNGKYLDDFLAYLSNPNPTTILIIEIIEKPDGRDKLFKEIKKKSYYLSLNTLDNSNLTTYAKERFSMDKYSVDSITISEIVKRSDNELSLLKENIKKLEIYKCDDLTVNLEDVNLLITRNVEDNVFDMVNTVLEHNVSKAFYLYKDLSGKNYDVTLLISLILNKFNELLLVKRLISGGYSKNDVMESFKVSSGRAYYMVRDANKADEGDIKNQINSLCLLEYQIKSGQIDKNIGFEVYLTKI